MAENRMLERRKLLLRKKAILLKKRQEELSRPSRPTGFGEAIQMGEPSIEQARKNIASLPAAQERVTSLRKDIALESLPIVGQILGGGVPGVVKGSLGAVTGATGGSALRSVAKGEDIDPSRLGKEAALIGALELLTKGAGKFFFKKPRAIQEVREGAGKRVGEIKEVLNTVDSGVDIDTVLLPMKEGVDKIAVPSGKQASALKKWIKKLNEIKKSGRKTLTGNELRQLEEQMGAASTFGAKKVGGIEVITDIKNPEANKLVKNIRKLASDEFDDFATRSGRPEFKALSKKTSEALKASSQKELSVLNRLQAASVIGAGTGVATGDPLSGIGTSAGLFFGTSPTVRNTLFTLLERLGLGAAIKAGATQGTRKIIE